MNPLKYTVHPAMLFAMKLERPTRALVSAILLILPGLSTGRRFVVKLVFPWVASWASLLHFVVPLFHFLDYGQKGVCIFSIGHFAGCCCLWSQSPRPACVLA